MIFLASLFFLTFVLLMISNVLMWMHIKKHNLTTKSKIKDRKYMTIIAVFAVSYLYRVFYDIGLIIYGNLDELAQ